MAAENKLRDYLKRVTVELTEARRQLAEAQATSQEPIAIIGMSCRLPGADSVSDYWRLLYEGRSAVLDDVPAGRYDLTPYVEGYGVYTRRGAFLSDIAGWDAEFFGYSPREALRTDPQQRLLMELTWEALEHAGTPPPRIAGSRTAVVIGFSDTTQYGRLAMERQGVGVLIDPYSGQGTSASVVAGRLAYHFDLRGPTLSVDTACSSSLVAVHLAAEALRRGECDLAVAGASSLVLQPDMYVNACATSMLSRDGLCKTFDASADGYAMGEGGGVVILQRLSDALAAGRRILAVIRGSAVNQDGRSNGMTAPNRQAQVDVIRRALAAARVRPNEVCYVEAHGSGTQLGDSIELGALNDVFGDRPAGSPLLVGAVKTNIGHTQAAAGIAGLIKTVLVLQHGEAPPNLNLTQPSEAMAASTTVRPVTSRSPLPPTDRPRVAGVSSFGWSGTNAHLVLEAAPASDPVEAEASPQLLPVSAYHDAALRAQLANLADALADKSLADAAFTLQLGRAEHRMRRAVVARDPAEAAQRLAEAAEAGGVRAMRRPRVALLLPDSPAGYRGMGSGLYTDPGYREAVDACVALAAQHCGIDLRPLLGLSEPDAAAPTEAADRLALFAVEYALARWLSRRGVTPKVLVGHGVGEHVAAALSGALPLAEALLQASRPPTQQVEVAEAVGSSPAKRAVQAPDSVAALPPLPDVQVVTVAVVNGEARLSADLAGQVDAFVELAPAATLRDLVNPHLTAEGYLIRGLPEQPTDGSGEVVALLETCARLWEIGVALDFSALHDGRCRLTDLPGYPFQRQRYWIDPPAGEPVPAPSSAKPVAGDPAEAGPASHVQLLIQRWCPQPLTENAGTDGRFLLIGSSDNPVVAALADRLRRDGGEVTTVADGVDEALRKLGGVTVIDLSSLQDAADTDPVAAVVRVSQNLAACGEAAEPPARVVVVSRGGQQVCLTSDTPEAAEADQQAESVVPAQAAVAVLPVVANQEYLELNAGNVDLHPDEAPATAAELLAAEVRSSCDAVVLAYRNGRRYVPEYDQVTAEPAEPVPGGVYLITGGLGTIGLTVARHLADRGATDLVLVSRSGLPDDLDDPRRIAVERLRESGVRVHTPRLNVTDQAAMRAVFTELAAAGTRIGGVVHAAADTGTDAFRPLRDLDEALVARQFGAKVDGARVLRDIIAALPADQAPDWCLLFSSTSALLGGVTFGGYAAANAALTALGQGVPGPTRWISAGWDTWACTLTRLTGGVGASMVNHSMSDAEALDAFDRLVGLPGSAVVVAAGGLADRLPRPAGDGADAVPAEQIRHPRPDLPQPYAPPLTAAERDLAEVWSDVLGVDPVGIDDNYFDLGGTSLLVPHLLGLVKQRFGVAVPTVSLFEAPTVRTLAALIDAGRSPAAAASATPSARPAVPAPPVAGGSGTEESAVDPAGSAVDPAVAAPPARQPDQTPMAAPQPALPAPAGPAGLDRRIAIIGMAGRFPGAEDVDAFWRALCDGEELISFFSPEELIDAGVAPELARDPSYVRARPILDDITGFDAAFFGLSPRMAALTDPQQRLFLEICWEALERAGYARPEHRGRVGVFAGTNISTYLLGALGQLRLQEDLSEYELIMGNDKDALTTMVSYLFDLGGPSMAVQTFCSTSLVAVHEAVRSLRSGECEMALAGGVSIRVPDKIGHEWSPGGMESRDGHVYTFDARASGTLFGDGATVVVLKRLDDALRDGDYIYGVILGSAVTNDGALKVGYTAPSVTGQARAVADALRDAGVSAEDISYVEAHGTATELGDPIEVAALTRAFGATTRRQYCPIGAVKTNVGHLNHAAGAAGLIKTALALRSQVIPPTLHYTTPNPAIDFANSPFYVNTELAKWPAPNGRPRIAGVNSVGMGGTNAHVVVQEPPALGSGPQPDGDPDNSRRYQVLPVSARTATAADRAAQRLGEHLRSHPDIRLADVAYSLQVGRKTFEHRRVAVVSDVAEAVATFTGHESVTPPMSRLDTVVGRRVAFLFAGVGEQYPGLVDELYRREPVFRAALAECLRLMTDSLPGLDLIDLLTGARGGGSDLATLLGRTDAGSSGRDQRAETLRRTEVAQPLLFAVEYALAATLRAWGLEPSVMLGYSLGEYVAACLAGVLSLADATKLVVHRAKLIAEAPTGSMMAVALAADELRRRFRLDQRGVDIAAINGPETVVVAGPTAALAQLAADLRQAMIASRPIETSHAFHSRMLAGLSDELTTWVAANVQLNPPQRPYLSNVTGGLAEADLVCDPAYWARHMCQPVQFAAGVEALLTDPELAIVEIGPGQSLGALIRAAGYPADRWPMITATLPAASDPRPADRALADCLARLWLLGVEVDWVAYHGRSGAAVYSVPPGRIPLPTYSFERQRYWIEPAPLSARGDRDAEPPTAPTSLADVGTVPRQPEERWLYLPVWRQTSNPPASDAQPANWLVFSRDGLAEDTLAQLRETAAADGATVIAVRPGSSYRHDSDGFTIRPGNVADALQLLRELRVAETPLERVVHLWTLDEPAGDTETVALGLHTLVALARAAGELGLTGWTLDLVSIGTQQVLHGGEVRPANATLIGPNLVIPLEYPSVRTRLIDAEPTTRPTEIVAELRRPTTDSTVAIRGGRRWVCDYELVPPTDLPAARSVLREGGVYLLTGGLGGIALGLAEHLVRDCRARLVLFGRTGLPPADRWADILAGADEVDEGVRSRVARVQALIDLGGEVEIVVGDVTDPGDVRRAVERAHERFGALHGVLHTAGVPGTGLMQFKLPPDSELVLAPKVAGARAIVEALRVGADDEVRLDFLVFFSSITSVTGGGPGQVDYCAANAFLDRYAGMLSASGRRTLSMSWGEWAWNAWDSGLSGFEAEVGTFLRENRARFGITFDEGWRTLLRALASAEPHLVVSTQDLPTMVRFAAQFTVEAVTTSAAGAGSAGVRHPRPELVTPYQEPAGSTEKSVAAIWCESLKLERVGAADNFFELGGNSLLGIALLNTLRRAFPAADLPPHILYEAPTVAALARVIDGANGPSEKDTEEDGQLRAQRRRSGLKAAAARRRMS